MNVVVVDNYDSFTFNLVYDLEALGCDVAVVCNDIPVQGILDQAAPDAVLVLSPGPGGPDQAGCCVELVRAAAGRFGVLGVCLGHQAIVRAFGGTVDRAAEPLHGRASEILWTPHPLFDALPHPLVAGRYHSLAATRVPADLDTIAVTAAGTVMAVAHVRHRIAGLQFHPESILTNHGQSLLRNALAWLGSGGDRARVA